MTEPFAKLRSYMIRVGETVDGVFEPHPVEFPLDAVDDEVAADNMIGTLGICGWHVGMGLEARMFRADGSMLRRLDLSGLITYVPAPAGY